MPWRTIGRCGAAAALVLVAAACSDDDGAPAAGAEPTATTAASETTTTAAPEPASTFPGETWERADAAGAGLDVHLLDQLAVQAEAAGSTCLVVTRDGVVVDERYFGDADDGTRREAFSVTKSITSVLVGIAQDQGHLRIDEPASTYIPEWRGTPSEAVTIENLLSNDSGRFWDLGTDYGTLIGAADKTGLAISLGQAAPPGEVWAYNNAAIQTLEAVLEAAVGRPVADFARTELFEPIGMADSELTTDGAGNALTFMGLRTTCLDLARFGTLAMHDGGWDGTDVVSPAYMDAATGSPSTDLNAAYGYLWWLNHEGPIGSPLAATTGAQGGDVAAGQLVPDAPDDAFWALGFRNQVVAVLPSEGIVAVRMGEEPPPEAPFTQSDLTNGVLAALVADEG